MPTDRPRGAMGKYARNPDAAARDAEACRLRARGYTYQQIADQLGYASKGHAHTGVSQALKDIVREPAEELRQLELGHLYELRGVALAVMEAHHITVSNGRIVYLGDEPLKDHGPVLAAIDRLNRISERIAKLTGLDAPVKHDVTVTDALTAEIKQLADELEQVGEIRRQQDAARERG